MIYYAITPISIFIDPSMSYPQSKFHHVISQVMERDVVLHLGNTHRAIKNIKLLHIHSRKVVPQLIIHERWFMRTKKGMWIVISGLLRIFLSWNLNMLWRPHLIIQQEVDKQTLKLDLHISKGDILFCKLIIEH